VRELSHVLQFELLKSARKRMEKYIPGIVGAWLAGTYDRDRPVARAANDGITSFLDTEEKVLSFWRRCQHQILAYAQEAIKETPQTLSDERSMNSDDVQAKYDRVIGASMLLVVNLLIKLDDNNIQKHQEAYAAFLAGNKDLWGFIASNDAFLRRATAQLLSVCLDKQSQIIEGDLGIISHAFISEGLRSPQNSSNLQILQALNRLTQKFPTVWSTAYKGKNLPLARLSQFIEKGSQGGPSEYWQVLTSLIKRLPTGILPKDLDGAVDLLKAYRHGITSREEARTNAPAGWAGYLEVVQQLRSGLSDTSDSEQLLPATVFPVFEQFLRPVPEQSSWSMGNNTVPLAKAFGICCPSEHSQHQNSLAKEWWRLTELLATDMLMSLSEQSKDRVKSQAAVVAEAHRWFGLQAEIIKSPELANSVDKTINFLSGPCSSVIVKALEVISVRNGKPFCAAGILEAALRITPKLVSTVSSTQEAIASFLHNVFPKLLTSPSSDYLIASMFAFGLLPDQEELVKGVWKVAVHGLVTDPNIKQTTKAIRSLISNQKISELAQEDIHLQVYLLDYISKVVQGQLDEWSIYEGAIAFDSLSTESASSIMSVIIHSLGKHDNAFRALEFICRKRPQLLRIEDGTYIAVMKGLLSLLESPDQGTVSRASALKNIIEKADTAISGSNQVPFPILEIIKENLENVGPQSLS
jgi:E3 ubiquitin-protein ligase listerin